MSRFFKSPKDEIGSWIGIVKGTVLVSGEVEVGVLACCWELVNCGVPDGIVVDGWLPFGCEAEV